MRNPDNSHAYSLLRTLLSFWALLTIFFGTTKADTEDNQCSSSAWPYTTNLSTLLNVCIKNDYLLTNFILSDYFILTNVRTLNETEIIFIAEVHHEPHTRTDDKLIKKILNPGDVLLIEGLDANIEVDCSERLKKVKYIGKPFSRSKNHGLTCFGWEHDIEMHRKHAKHLALVQEKTTRLLEEYKKLISKSENIFKELKKHILKITNKRNSKNKSLQQPNTTFAFNSLYDAINLLCLPEEANNLVLYIQQELHKIMTQFNARTPNTKITIFFQAIDSLKNAVVSHTNHIGFQHIQKIKKAEDRKIEDNGYGIIARNNGLMETISTKYAKFPGKLFIVAGAKHAIPDVAFNTNSGVATIDKKDPSYAFRLFLSKRRHAILIHKDAYARAAKLLREW